MRAKAALAIVPASLSCAAPDSQQSYTYPGCDAGTAYCPNSLTFTCALETIQQKYTACQTTADCVLVPFSRSSLDVADHR